MAEPDDVFEDEDIDASTPLLDATGQREELRRRCTAANIDLEDVISPGEPNALKLGMRSGRAVRWIYIWSDERLTDLLSIDFGSYVFLTGFEAICSYTADTIEAAIRPVGGFSRNFASLNLMVEPRRPGFPRIEVSKASDCFSKLVRVPMRDRPTLKIGGGKLSSHDQAIKILTKTADAAFFQIDLLSGMPLGLIRQRSPRLVRRSRKEPNIAFDFQYPRIELDEAPISLYWYARSATGMPLLQFLAFYQVIEFYLPTYSQAEAHRKLKAILKDPTFRGDRDADVGRLLSSIQVSRSGAYGDERSQLRATLMECIDSDALREFLMLDSERTEFYSAKTKTFHRIVLSNPSADLRGDVSERMYDIRCKIVHTRNDGRGGEIELLLPFSKEAEQLSYDIDLIQYLAQQVLIAAGTPFQPSIGSISADAATGR